MVSVRQHVGKYVCDIIKNNAHFAKKTFRSERWQRSAGEDQLEKLKRPSLIMN
jgi:hypothetical protein